MQQRASRSPARSRPSCRGGPKPPFQPPWNKEGPCSNCVGTPFSQRKWDAVVAFVCAFPEWPSLLELIFHIIATIFLGAAKKIIGIKDEVYPSILKDDYKYPKIPVALWAVGGADLGRRAANRFGMDMWWWQAALAVIGAAIAVRRLRRWRKWLRDLTGEGYRVVEVRIIDSVLPAIASGGGSKAATRTADLKVLDLGAGAGRMTKHIIDRHGIAAKGIDLDAKPPLVEQYDGQTIPFPANSFDLVLCLYIYHHFEHQLSVLQQCAKVSQRVLIFEDLLEETTEPLLSRIFFGFHFLAFKQPFHTHLNRTRVEWRQLLRRAGFEVEQEFDVPATLVIPYNRVGLLAKRRE